MLKTATTAEEASSRIGSSGAAGGEKFASEMEKGTNKVGGLFTKLGQSASNWGLPFSGTLTKIGSELSTTGQKGAGFADAMSAAGAVTVAAFAGVSVEAVRLADKFDTAQANLQTAVKNSGGVWAAYSSAVSAAAKTTGALVTGNATDVDQALTILTTATGNAQKALGDLNLTENISAMRHISLADAASLLAKVYAGSTRVLTSFGINLDIGSGKLHSVQAAEEAVQSATLNLSKVQAEVNTGQLVGAQAAGALASAHLTLRNDNLNLVQSQHAIAEALDALNAKTKGAATAVGHTLGGEIEIARHSLENMGISLGEILIPKLDDLVRVGATVLGWFERNKTAADALGIAVGTTLAAAVAVFTYNTLAKLATGLVNIGQSFANLATNAVAKMGITNTATEGAAAVETSAAGETVTAQETIRARLANDRGGDRGDRDRAGSHAHHRRSRLRGAVDKGGHGSDRYAGRLDRSQRRDSGSND